MASFSASQTCTVYVGKLEKLWRAGRLDGGRGFKGSRLEGSCKGFARSIELTVVSSSFRTRLSIYLLLGLLLCIRRPCYFFEMAWYMGRLNIARQFIQKRMPLVWLMLELFPSRDARTCHCSKYFRVAVTSYLSSSRDTLQRNSGIRINVRAVLSLSFISYVAFSSGNCVLVASVSFKVSRGLFIFPFRYFNRILLLIRSVSSMLWYIQRVNICSRFAALLKFFICYHEVPVPFFFSLFFFFK